MPAAISYNPGMAGTREFPSRRAPARVAAIALLAPILLLAMAVGAFAGGPKTEVAEGGNADVAIKATFVPQEQLKQIVGTDFGKMFTTLNVQVTPKNGKPLAISYDDFELLSQSSGEHGSPYEAGQISGSGALVLHREDRYGSVGVEPTSSVWSLGPIMGGGGGGPKKAADNRVDMVQGSSSVDPLTDLLKKKMLPQTSATASESGLLIFPVANEKPKHLVLYYKTADGKLRLTFKNE